jgi:hypothetical protein
MELMDDEEDLIRVEAINVLSELLEHFSPKLLR